MKGAAAVLGLIGLIVLLAAGCGQNGASPSRSPAADYYPLALGDRWTYRMSPARKVYTAEVTATRRIAGVTTYAVAVEDTYSYLAARPDGVYQYGEGDPDQPQSAVILSPPELVYKLPFDIGDTWETPALAEPLVKNSETVFVDGQVDAIDTVPTPAGTFTRCAKLTIEDPRQSPADRTDLWLAPDVGIVKTVTYITIGAGKPKTTTTELVAYHLSGK